MLNPAILQNLRRLHRRLMLAVLLSMGLLEGCSGFAMPVTQSTGSVAEDAESVAAGTESVAAGTESVSVGTESVVANAKAAPERRILVTLTQTDPQPLRAAGSTSRQYVGSSTYTRSERTRRVVARLARQYRLLEVEGWPIRALGVYCVVFEVPAGQPMDDMVNRLARDARVESVQPMQRFEVLGSRAAAYDDPYVEMQHGLSTMRVFDVHPSSGGRGVTLAVVDTGVDRAHMDLAASVVMAKDFVSDLSRKDQLSGPGQLAELHGISVTQLAELHGTAVAGVIASVANNGIGTVGVAPASRILALRACWEPPGGTSGICNSFTLAKALAFVVDHRPDIVNLSLTGPRDPLLERLLRVALDDGIAVVTAYDRDVESVAFPGCLEGVLVVQSDAAEWVAEDPTSLLRAPGQDILATHPGDRYDFVSGSSFAAAHVSGVLALLLERAPGLKAEQLAAILRSTSRSVAGLEGKTTHSIDACAALDRAVPGSGCVTARGVDSARR